LSQLQRVEDPVNGLRHLGKENRPDQKATGILSQGLAHFPEDARLNICMGVSLMNLGEYERALTRFLEFQQVKDAVNFAARCYKALGDEKKATEFFETFAEMSKNQAS